MAGSCEYFLYKWSWNQPVSHYNPKPQIKTKTKKNPNPKPSNNVVKLEAQAYPVSEGGEDQDFKVILSYSEFEVSLGYRPYTEPWPACACEILRQLCRQGCPEPAGAPSPAS